jgi:hypothetical protein
MTDDTSTVRTVKRGLATVGGGLVRLLGVGLLVGYLAVWLGLAATHVVRGDFAAAVITLVVFVLPVVSYVLWRRLKTAALARDDADVDVGSPSP